jgi:hypothetical protein
MKKFLKVLLFWNVESSIIHTVLWVQWQPIDRQLIDHDNSSTGLRNDCSLSTAHRHSTHRQAPRQLINLPEASLGACQEPPSWQAPSLAPVGALLGGHLASSLSPSPSFAARWPPSYLPSPFTQLCCRGESAVPFCHLWAAIRLLMNHFYWILLFS